MSGRPRSCECGSCAKCRNRERMRAQYQAMTTEERRALAARRDPEKMRVRARARRAAGIDWRRDNPERAREIDRRSRARHPEKIYARSLVNNAIQAGRLQKGPCEAEGQCDGLVEAHHDDYSKPLDVRWLCRRHHEEVHLRLGVAS